jgi:hypothetical protein
VNRARGDFAARKGLEWSDRRDPMRISEQKGYEKKLRHGTTSDPTSKNWALGPQSPLPANVRWIEAPY